MMNKCEIVLINVPHTDLSSKKIRPALVLAKIQDDLLCCFISSNVDHVSSADVLVKKSKENNLKVDSLIKCGKLFTLHSSLVEWTLGSLEKPLYEVVKNKLKMLID